MIKKAKTPTEIPFVIRKSKIQGKGAYATRPIRKGERIIEYVGERISWEESDRRYDDTKVKRHHTFLFAVNKKIVIDAAVDGNEARFINHSCDPNCEAVGVGLRIFIEAIRQIKEGDELVYDYSYAREDTDEEDEKLYICRCGSAKCRGTILAPPKKRKRKKRVASGRKLKESSSNGLKARGRAAQDKRAFASNGTRTSETRVKARAV